MTETIEVPKEEYEELQDRVQALEDGVDRYETLWNVVVSITELDRDTLDLLVEQRRKEGESQ